MVAGNQRKSQKTLKLDEKITIPNGDKYELKAVADHSGSTINSGHYTAVVRDGDLWYKANDTNAQWAIYIGPCRG